MRIRITGRIVNAEPRLPSRIAGKRLILDGKGREHMILDSGFTGSIAISEEWANRLDLRYAGIQPFELANGQIVEFPTYLGIGPKPSLLLSSSRHDLLSSAITPVEDLSALSRKKRNPCAEAGR